MYHILRSRTRFVLVAFHRDSIKIGSLQDNILSKHVQNIPPLIGRYDEKLR